MKNVVFVPRKVVIVALILTTIPYFYVPLECFGAIPLGPLSSPIFFITLGYAAPLIGVLLGTTALSKRETRKMATIAVALGIIYFLFSLLVLRYMSTYKYV